MITSPVVTALQAHTYSVGSKVSGPQTDSLRPSPSRRSSTHGNVGDAGDIHRATHHSWEVLCRGGLVRALNLTANEF